MRQLTLLGLVLYAAQPVDLVILTPNDIADGFYESVPDDVLGQAEWLGLYASDAGSQLQAATVAFEQVGDAEYPEFAIRTTPPDPVLLFAGVTGLEPGTVTTLSRWPVSLSAAEPALRFELGSRSYTVQLSASDASLCDATVTLMLASRTETLHSPADNQFACDEPHFDVEWVGDLDRDGDLDLLATFSSKYSHHPRLLFLSSTAEAPNLVGEALRYDKSAR